MKKIPFDYILKTILPVLIFVGAISYLITFLVLTPERFNVGYAPTQPIPFSHKLHAGVNQIDCKYCHVGVDKGRFATVPALDTCMGCHSQVLVDKPNIQLLTKFYKSGKPMEWKRIHKLPDHVYFNHSVHIAKGIQCVSCHGDVASMDVIEKKNALHMGVCIDCHRSGYHDVKKVKSEGGVEKYELGPASKGPENCSTCHR